MKLAPIVIFCYNRPYHLKKTLNSLKKNKLSKQSVVWFFSDGHKQEDKKNEKLVNSVRSIIKNTNGFKKKKIIFHQDNIGLKKNILNGVSRVLKKYKKVIVLEDDIEVSVFFLKYMNDSLNKYQKKRKVWHISGWNYDINFKNNKEEVFFIKNMNCWGWGTWQDRWKKIIIKPDFFIKKFDTQMINRFDLSNSLNNWSQLLRNKNKRLKTWAIFWNATIFYNNGLCLNPLKSLTRNIGLDGSGTNSSKIYKKKKNLSQLKEFNYPNKLEENLIIKKEIIQSFEKKHILKPFKTIKGKIKSFLYKDM